MTVIEDPASSRATKHNVLTPLFRKYCKIEQYSCNIFQNSFCNFLSRCRFMRKVQNWHCSLQIYPRLVKASHIVPQSYVETIILLVSEEFFFFLKDDCVAAIAFLGEVIKYTCFGYGNLRQVYLVLSLIIHFHKSSNQLKYVSVAQELAMEIYWHLMSVRKTLCWDQHGLPQRDWMSHLNFLCAVPLQIYAYDEMMYKAFF